MHLRVSVFLEWGWGPFGFVVVVVILSQPIELRFMRSTKT